MTRRLNNEVRRPSTTPSNTTNVHLHQARSATPRTAGLQSIAATSKVFGDIPSALVQQHRANERLAIATSPAPWCNSTTPRDYRAPELAQPPARTTIGRAHQLPSRMGAHLFHPDGRVTTLDGQTVRAAP